MVVVVVAVGVVVVVISVCVCVCVWGGGGGVGVGTSMGYARHARRKIVIYRSGFDSTLVIWPLKDTKTDS